MMRPSLAVVGSLLSLAVFACGPSARNNTGDDDGTDGGSNARHDGGSSDPNCPDEDGDGYTTCDGDCCDNTNQCSNPAQVNPGAYDVGSDGVDNDCDGVVDNGDAACDSGVSGQSTNAMDYAKAIDLCQTTTMDSNKWGVIDAKLTYADGTGVPDSSQHAILSKYGTNVTPHAGAKLALFSTGVAAGKNDPGFDATLSTEFGNSSPFPADFLAANGGNLPNAPGCDPPDGNQAGDPVMLTLKIRVPTNAGSFSLDTNFFSSEFPEYTCTPFNDFFVVLLDSQYVATGSGAPNPSDKNLAIYTASGGQKYPVGVNLASGNTGLFTQCVNGHVGCAEEGTGTINTCTATTDLAGTGLDKSDPEQQFDGIWDGGGCDANSQIGGGTGWLTTSGNVKPGEVITVRIALWDTSDDALDSLAVLDNWKWAAAPSNPGTVIGIVQPQN